MKLVLVSMIIIFPAVSWYYLQSGLNYRKAALEELKPKGDLTRDVTKIDQLKGKTTLIQLQDVDMVKLNSIYNQYQLAETFQVLSHIESDDLSKKWYVLDDLSLAALRNQYETASFVLVDTSLQVRNTYAHSDEDFIKMVEHLAIVMPRKKDKDIKIRREEEI